MTNITPKEYTDLCDGVKRMIWRKFGTYDANMLADAVSDTWLVVSEKELPKPEMLKLWARSAVNRYIDMLRTEQRRRQLNKKLKVEIETGLAVFSSLELMDEVQRLRKMDREYVLHILTMIAENSGQDLRTVAEQWFKDNISSRPRHLQDSTKRIRDWVLALG
jgi:DNA-directed RNA polymerase specialized sigma24 family protein